MRMSFLPTMDYFARTLPEESWLVDHLIPRGGLVELYGKPKCGKSLLTMTLVSALADGYPWFLHPSFKIRVRGNVLFLQMDTPPGLWTGYLRTAQRPFKDVYWADQLQVPHPPFDIHDQRHRDWLRNQITDYQPTLLVVDSLRKLHRGDENDSSIMTKVMALLRQTVGLDTAILLIAHQKKIGAMDVADLVDSARGSSAVAGEVDVLMRLSGDRPTKKYFEYTGRTRAVNNSLELWQDQETGLLRHGQQRHQRIVQAQLDHPGGENVRQLIQIVRALGIDGSDSTIRRDIEQLGLF